MPDATASRHLHSVVVVGGGIAGLSAAWELSSADPGLHVVVLEADARLGGKLLSVPLGGRAVDLGPDAFLARRPEAVELCRELGIDDELVAPGSRTAYVWSRHRLRPLPEGLALGVPTRVGPLARSGIVSRRGVIRAAVDLLGWGRGDGRSGADRAVADITRRRLGREVTDRLVDPLIGGIHAGDTARLSAAAVFPPLLQAGARGGSLMRALRSVVGAAPATASAAPSTGSPGSPGSPGDGPPPVFLTVSGGMSRLVQRLAEALRGRGVDVRTEWRVERLELHRRGVDAPPGMPGPSAATWTVHGALGTVEADAVVIAAPAEVAAGLLETVEPTCARLLAGIDTADVALVTLRFGDRGVAHALAGTGFLVPRVEGGLVTACTWLTSKWPHLRRPGDVVLRASAGRWGDDRPAGMSDDELVARVLDELGPVVDIREPPIESVVTRWPGAFPQYAPGHLERIAAIEAGVASLPGLALAGAALHGVGIPACIGSGRRAAGAILGTGVVAEGSPR